MNELSLLRLARDPDYATYTEAELSRKLAAIGLIGRQAERAARPVYRPGDRVTIQTAGGGLAATVREAVADPAGRTLYVVEPDASTAFPRMVVSGFSLSPGDEADPPHLVTGGVRTAVGWQSAVDCSIRGGGGRGMGLR